MLRFILLSWVLIQSSVALTSTIQPRSDQKIVRILADLNMLRSMGIHPISTQENMNLAIADITEYQATSLTHFAHNYKKCGGFELLSESIPSENQALANSDTAKNSMMNSSLENSEKIYADLQKYNKANDLFSALSFRLLVVPSHDNIKKALDEVKEENLQETVNWLSSFPTRFHKNEGGQKTVTQFYNKIQEMVQASNRTDVKVEFVTHSKTPQKSIRVHVEGQSHPEEIVVLGGHFDSISMWGLGNAPGADDNASGSANILEALRIFLSQPRPARSVEFFWYAGEEGGLIGSAEIAEKYKEQNKKVIGALQLDMTLFPGAGDLVMGEMTDFTSTWLRDYLHELNNLYVGAQWQQDKCGYGCSDHASWYKNGFPSVIPFEATMKTMNSNLHTPEDVVSTALNFKHSAMFAKLALAYAMDLSNSDLKQPY